jgi:hypothetical protein
MLSIQTLLLLVPETLDTVLKLKETSKDRPLIEDRLRGNYLCVSKVTGTRYYIFAPLKISLNAYFEKLKL